MANPDKAATDLKDEAKAAKQAIKDAEKAASDAQTTLTTLQAEAGTDIVALLTALIPTTIGADVDIMDLFEAMYPEQNAGTIRAHLDSIAPTVVAGILTSFKLQYG